MPRQQLTWGCCLPCGCLPCAAAGYSTSAAKQAWRTCTCALLADGIAVKKGNRALVDRCALLVQVMVTLMHAHVPAHVHFTLHFTCCACTVVVWRPPGGSCSH